MGFLKRVGVLWSPDYREWRAEEEKWARILEIGPKLGPLTNIRLEVHYSGMAPQILTVTTRIPRGVKPQVGQEVALGRVMLPDGYNGPAPQIDNVRIAWGQTPQHGSDAAAQVIAQKSVHDALAAILPNAAAPSPGGGSVPSLEMYQQMLDSGQITEEAFERIKAAFDS